MDQVERELQRLQSILLQSQMPDGSWRFCFESGILSDAYMIILLRSLELEEEELIQQLTDRILSRQENNGAWRLFYDEGDGNLSVTIEAYFALLYGGCCTPGEEHMVAARNFILANGGIRQARYLTKIMLALTGQYSWDEFFHIPVETILLPPSFPVNFYDFVGFARVHIAPILIVSDRDFFIKNSRTPDLSSLYVKSSTYRQFSLREDFFSQFIALFNTIHEGIRRLTSLPVQIHQAAIRRLEQFMLERVEPDGTLYSFFSASFLMIFALRALNYQVDDPVITRAVKGLKALICRVDANHIHLQNSTSTVWDTALLSYALQESGIQATHPAIEKAGKYLFRRQQKRFADWKIHNPGGMPGAWGFSDVNTLSPDVDDTTATLRALYPYRMRREWSASYSTAWRKGLKWVLTMQNGDGGWPAFEKNTDKCYVSWLPYPGMEGASTDPSSADLTGRTLEFLGSKTHLHLKDHVGMQRGIRWLFRNQEEDGSWYGRWGICYIYGTWAALTGMAAVGVPSYIPAVQKAAHWLMSIQNPDGGWGESCLSDHRKKYVPLGASTLSQTAWAVDALLAVVKGYPDEEVKRAIEGGVRFLVDKGENNEWPENYPTGGGLPGSFYSLYHSYRYIWPLLALSHYRRDMGEGNEEKGESWKPGLDC